MKPKEKVSYDVVTEFEKSLRDESNGAGNQVQQQPEKKKFMVYKVLHKQTV